MKERIDETKKKTERLEQFNKSLKSSLVYVIDRNPHIDFTGQEFKLKVVNNGGKQAVTLAFGLDFHELKKVVNPQYFDDDCIEQVNVWCLKEGVEDRVREGESISAFELQPRGRSLKIS